MSVLKGNADLRVPKSRYFYTVLVRTCNDDREYVSRLVGELSLLLADEAEALPTAEGRDIVDAAVNQFRARFPL